MCGFIGFLGGIAGKNECDGFLRRMLDTLVHRGPDDSGYWLDCEQRIGFGHRRLSIVDLSPAGHQPMVSASGRYVIAFNGEVYNHLDLRRELEECTFFPSYSPVIGRGKVFWRGHSDTETLLAGVEAWGLETTLNKSIGMFAMAVWDRETSTLTLTRDRIGEKPLYYGWQSENTSRVFLFGSELKSLKAHPAFSADIDRGALCLLLRHNYIPCPYSIYKGISKLEAGSLLSVSLAQPEPKIL